VRNALRIGFAGFCYDYFVMILNFAIPINTEHIIYVSFSIGT
jgi:hypothetical protein